MTTNMLEVLTIDSKENDTLFKIADTIELDSIPTLLPLIKKMKDFLAEDEHLGLAAPQIGKPIRMFVMIKNKTNYRVCINPVILKRSSTQTCINEGCLSLPGVIVPVKRSRRITVRYYNEFGKLHKETLTDLQAIIFQHELDHLNGTLIPASESESVS